MFPGEAGEVWRDVHVRCYEPVDRPGSTELPGLTSDPICTADRRGGILISFGPYRTTLKGINPSKGVRESPRDGGTG
jgi:hypothetical protein